MKAGTPQKRMLQQVRPPLPQGNTHMHEQGQMTSSPAPHHRPGFLDPWVHEGMGRQGPMAEMPCPSSRVPDTLPRAPPWKEKEERQPRAASAL